jgi:hypothetical protein
LLHFEDDKMGESLSAGSMIEEALDCALTDVLRLGNSGICPAQIVKGDGNAGMPGYFRDLHTYSEFVIGSRPRMNGV